MKFEITFSDSSTNYEKKSFVIAEKDIELDEPKMFNVILLNDDYTPMDFVVELLIRVFHKIHSEAYSIMLKIHLEGRAVVGIFPLEIAQAKKEKSLNIAEVNEFPLNCIIEHA